MLGAQGSGIYSFYSSFQGKTPHRKTSSSFLINFISSSSSRTGNRVASRKNLDERVTISPGNMAPEGGRHKNREGTHTYACRRPTAGLRVWGLPACLDGRRVVPAGILFPGYHGREGTPL